MSADIRLVKLKRRSVNWGEDRDEDGAISMDYFDVLEVKRFYSYNTLMDIMDTGNDGEEGKEDISMQSYPLYCSEDIIKKYENCKGYEDPFEELADGSMLYLSIIQVHITPEVLVRLKCGNEVKFSSLFLEDLHKILIQFVDSVCQEELTIRYRIYQSLAAGDFAVVIRSRSADSSFYVSSAIRKRIAKNAKKSNADSDINLVLYKTYTVWSYVKI